MIKHLHIISFDIPYPADYGGVIDVFYKIKAFHKAGINVHLHCFEYGREHTNELNKYCSEVHYYKRNTGLKANLSKVPYIINSRISKELANRLNIDNYPILCEGIHSCGILYFEDLYKNRKIIYRAHNVEHEYYNELHKSEKNVAKKLYYKLEATKLLEWETNLEKVDLILTLSENDRDYYKSRFKNKKVLNTFLFYNNDKIQETSLNSIKKYILYHANLSVNENIEAALTIINNIAPKIDTLFIIAGKNPSKSIYTAAKDKANVEIIANLSEDKMRTILINAHINILITKQATGLKLKLINSIYQGKHIIANNEMLSGSHLDKCVNLANTDNEIIEKVNILMDTDFSIKDYKNRLFDIPSQYNNDKQIKEIINIIY